MQIFLNLQKKNTLEEGPMIAEFDSKMIIREIYCFH